MQVLLAAMLVDAAHLALEEGKATVNRAGWM